MSTWSRIRIFNVVLAGLVLASPISKAVAQSDSVRDVAEAMPGFLDEGNVGALLALFTEDAVFVHPRLPAVAGRDSLELFLEQIFGAQSSSGARLNVLSIQTSGDWAHLVADFSTTWTPTNGGGPFTENARYLWMLRRIPNQGWRLKSFAFYPLR